MAAPIATKLVLNTKNFTQGLNVATKGLGGLKAAVGGVLGLITKLGLAFTAFGGIITALILRQAQFIDRLGKVSDVIGVNIETLQKFRFAAEQSGIGIDQADVALRRFARRLGEAQRNTGELAPALRRLGIETRNADGTLKSAEEVLLEFADGVADTENKSQRLALAFKAFDSEGAELVKTLEQGSEGLKAFFDEAESLGIILDRQTVKGVEDFNDALNKLQTLASGVFSIFVAELAPALEEVTRKFTDFVLSFKDEEGSFKSLGQYLKDQFLQTLVVIIQVLEKFINVLAAVGNKMIEIGRALNISGFPELSESAKQAKEELDALKRVQDGLFYGMTKGQAKVAIEGLKELGYNVDELMAEYDNLNLLEKIAGPFSEGGAAVVDKVNELIKQLMADALATYEAESEVFKGADFSSIIDLLIGNTEEAKEKAKDAANGVIEEVLVTGKKLKPGFLDIILDSLFPTDLVDKFFDTYDDKAATTAEKVKAMFTLVGESIERALPNLKDKLVNSGIGDFTQTLEDGLVKAGQMLEDSLAQAIATGKADFTALGDHIKQVLAKALVQKFITGPILSILGLPGRAMGGPVGGGKPYIVGEEGPELFVPNTSGVVVPNDKLSSGGGTPMMGGVVNYNISAVDARSFKQLVAQDPEFIFSVTQAGARRIPG